MAEALDFLENLSEQLAGIVQPIPGLNRTLLKNSLPRIASPRTGLREQWVMNRLKFQFSFALTKSSSGKIFFFFNKKRNLAKVVVDVAMGFSVGPTSDENRDTQLKMMPTLFRWSPPGFLILDPGKLARLTSSAGISMSDKVVGLSGGNGQDLLIEFKKENKDKAQVWYRNKKVEKSSKNRWPDEPFFELYKDIRDWKKGTSALQESRLLQVVEDSDVSQIVQQIATAHSTAQQALAVSETKTIEEKDLLESGLFNFQLGDFHADILLRLDEEGNVALFDSRRSFQFGLHLEIRETISFHEANITMELPDFLMEGALYEAFWEVFLQQDEQGNIKRALLDKLNANGYQIGSIKELVELLELGKKGGGTVFRIDRDKKTDINLFIVSGKLDQEPVTLVFSGKFEVSSIKPPKVTLARANSLKILYWPKDNVVDQDIAAYFFRLTNYFKNWLDVLI